MNDAIILHIQPESARLCMEAVADGIVQYKEISKDALLGCIHGSMAREAMSSGILPENCFHFAQLDQGERDYCLRYPALYANISYYQTTYRHFPLPRLVFGFHVDSGGKVFHCRVGVVADQRLTGDIPSRLNRTSTLLMANSFYIIVDLKQREKMTEEFYAAVKKEIAEYQERADYLVQSGSQSPAVMERWVVKIQALEQKKRHYEEILRRELDGLDDDFSTLKLLSQELAVRSQGIRFRKAA